jgi:hypothetical protein
MTAAARILPNWPAAMRKERAAAYLDLSIAAFEREVLTGRLPPPTVLDGKERWLRASLDRALEWQGTSDAENEFWRRYGRA